MTKSKPEKKNSGRRKPDDMTKKYPVDDILIQAKTHSIPELSKKFKLGLRIIHTIIKRYGSEELKKTVSARHPKAKKEAEKNEVIKEELSKVKDYMDNLEMSYTSLQTPTRTLSNIAGKVVLNTQRIEDILINGDDKIKMIIKDLGEKEFDPEKIDEVQITLRQYMEFNLKASRLLLFWYREQSVIQEKYVKLEAIGRDLQDVKTLIQYIFESYNLLDDNSYRKIKEHLTTLAPAIETYFTNFEESYNSYKTERIGQGSNGNGKAGEEAGRAKEETNGISK